MDLERVGKSSASSSVASTSHLHWPNGTGAAIRSNYTNAGKPQQCRFNELGLNQNGWRYVKPLTLGLWASLVATGPISFWLFTLDPSDALAWHTNLQLGFNALWLALAMAAALMGPWIAFYYRGTTQLREISMLAWVSMPLFAFGWQTKCLDMADWAIGLTFVMTMALIGLAAGRLIERFGRNDDFRISGRVAVQAGLALLVWRQSEIWLSLL